MDFIERQEAAKRKTVRLAILFVLCLLSMVTCVSVLFLVIAMPKDSLTFLQGLQAEVPLNPALLKAYLVTLALTFLIIGGGGLSRWWSLRKGSSSFAETLGGRLIQPKGEDETEFRLANVVEEMAIASGIPAPAVYVLDNHSSINAFAIQVSAHDRAIAVTRGALEKLSREELQAVVAHEFSHLLNEDSLINMRLLCLLSGLMAVSSLGRQLIATTAKSRTKVPGKGNDLMPRMAVFLLGLAILVVGSVGVFFGRILRAAISRQRELLADAAAVQFTRNPLALIQSLRKAAGDPLTVGLSGSLPQEIHHLLFVQGFKERWVGLFNTHPPLEERLKAIDPSSPLEPVMPKLPTTPEALPSLVHSLDHARLQFAKEVHGRISPLLLGAARDPVQAPIVVFAVLLSETPEVRDRQMQIIDLPMKLLGPDWTHLMPLLAASDALKKDPEKLRQALVELALPALLRMPQDAKTQFLGKVRALIQADQKTSLFEFATLTLLTSALSKRTVSLRSRPHQFSDIAPALRAVCWLVAQAGTQDPKQALASWKLALAQLGLEATSGTFGDGKRNADPTQALEEIDSLPAPRKKEVLVALGTCVLRDKEVTFAEAEVLRAVAAAISCPMPSLVNPV